jgi:hypothetical protein
MNIIFIQQLLMFSSSSSSSSSSHGRQSAVLKTYCEQQAVCCRLKTICNDCSGSKCSGSKRSGSKQLSQWQQTIVSCCNRMLSTFDPPCLKHEAETSQHFSSILLWHELYNASQATALDVQHCPV